MKYVFNIFMVFAIVLAVSNVSAAPFNTHSFSSESRTSLEIKSKSRTGFTAVSTLSYLNLSRLDSSKGSFTSLEIQGYSPGSGDQGKPLLPVLDNLIEVPQNATVQIVIHEIKEETLNLNVEAGGMKLAPRQPPRVKSRSRAEQPFVADKKAYAENVFGTNERISVDIMGGMRGVRVARLTVNPFRYNPGTNTLKAATRLSFSVVFKNGDMGLTKRTRAKYHSPLFKSAYSQILNYPLSDGTKDAIITDERAYPLTYVVVASDDFLDSSSLQTFIQWKRELGFHVIEANTNDIFYPSQVASATTAKKRERLQTYLKNLYDDGTHPPSYVLFVGDTDQIPPFETTDHVTDLYYFTFSGGYLPEAYYGRFPVETLTELNRVVSKTLTYEQYTMSSGAYLGEAMVIAGADEDFSPAYANGQVAYLINEYLNSDNNFSEVYAFLYNVAWSWPGVTTATTGSSVVTSAIKSRINSGAGFVNYTGHCNTYGWWNKEANDYELESSDITTLTNDDEYGFVVGNCCQSSSFDQDDSFGENIVLAQDKGAVAYIGASDYTFWDEDFYWAVGYKSGIEDLPETEIQNLSYNDTGYGNFDALWHNHSEAESDWYVTAGQMVYRGNLSVAMAVPASADYYFEVYNLMGDPSLMPYLRVPSTLANPTVGDTITPCDTTELTVTTVKYAQVALLHNGELADSAYSGNSTHVTLTFAPFDTGDTAELVISKQNYQVKRVAVTVDDLSSQSPVADFMLGSDPAASGVDVTSGVPMTFTNLSTGCPDTFGWTFEGGAPGSSSAQHPTVTYNELGYYDVQLIATNGKGDETLLINDYIHVVPGRTFTADQTRIPFGSTVTFTDGSTNNPTAWFWTFEGGNPATSTAQNPIVTYPDEPDGGLISYPVVLEVTIAGTPYTLTKDDYITVTVHKPVADFTSDKTTIKGGELITFTSTSTNNPTQLNWNFFGGSPASSTAAAPVVTYNRKGTYAVVLVATNDGGSNSMTKTAYITVTEDSVKPAPEGSDGGGGCFIRSADY
ncbi:MAG: C25 family cysteine peptidase [Desulfobacteraceae bacterium]|jgi:PKD repeat protein